MKVEVDVYVFDKEVQIQFDESFTFTYDRYEVEQLIVKEFYNEFEEIIARDWDSNPYEPDFSVELEYIDKNRLYRIIQENL